ncbi:hypothetical protein [Rhizobium sp. BK176]|uniref:hypothetical protein n=1 Tax=Rhizobium sp. BK176 TaxID=2587071 RepID=UPI0021682817|nr:hypothetical protein [Rhizobium sp. BK176]MCS4089069.1 hypothetical protein [Rhizobium sp. BK176]
MYPNHATYLMTAKDDPNVRKELVSRIADKFREALAVRLTESQLIGIDYANTYGVFFGEQTPCASHDYCDTGPVFWSVMVSALSEKTGGSGRRHPLHEPGRDLYDIIMIGDNDLGRVGASIWNDAWNAAVLKGFSSLWAVKEGIPAEATFKVLAEIAMTHPLRVPHDDPRYPGFPMITDFEAEIHAAALEFLAHATPLSVGDALEAATIVHQLVDNDDADGVIEYFSSFAPAPDQSQLRP